MPSPVFKSAEYWTQLIYGALVARCGLSDSSDTSVAKTLAAATGQCLEELSYNSQNILSVFSIDTAAGDDLDRRALDYLPTPLARIPAQPAVASLTFSRGSTGGAVTIPAGTRVTDGGQQAFLTQQDATIPAGQASLGQVAASAVVAGIAGNVAANTLTVFGQRPLGVDAVTNPVAATGGANAESDAAFRQRIRQYVSGVARGTPSALVAAVTGAYDATSNQTILYAAVEEDETRPGRSVLYVADAAGTSGAIPTAVTGDVLTANRLGPPPGSAQGGEYLLAFSHRPVSTDAPYRVVSSTRGNLTPGQDYTLDEAAGAITLAVPCAQGEVVTADYSYFTGVIALAQKIVDGDPSDRSTYPGIRAAGTQVVVQSPTIIIESVDATLTLDPAYAAAQVQAQVRAAIGNLMQTLPIGANLLVAELIATIMGVPGVVNVVLNQPASDVLAAPGQLIRPPADLSQIGLH